MLIENMGTYITQNIDILEDLADSMKIEVKSYIDATVLIHFSLVCIYQEIIAAREKNSEDIIEQRHNEMVDHLLCLHKGEYSTFIEKRIQIAPSIQNGRKFAEMYNSLPFPQPHKIVEHTNSSAIYHRQLVECLEEIKVIHDVYF